MPHTGAARPPCGRNDRQSWGSDSLQAAPCHPSAGPAGVSPMTKRVWVFRHAESLSNAGGKTLDPEGIPLTDHGRRQARDLAWSLKEAPQRVITSPFRRAIETGQPIDARYPAAVN